MRNLLLVGDALAANYLAEFAQNADDAGSSSMMVYFADDWLVVANSGNSLSSLDTVGLNRLFVGFKDGGVPIGKFGIGFKSCHHIANEVYVRSWGQDGFGFRLPISHSGDPESIPNSERLRAILGGIARVMDDQPGRTLPFDIDQWQDQTNLGHCTPEALPDISDHLPSQLRELVDSFQKNHHEHGVWFALHLHEEGQRKAQERISEQAEVQYELAPLFLRNLRSVTLQNRTMRMLVGRPIGTAVGKTAASSVTLEISTPGENNRNDRLLLLSSGANPTWKIALPADGDFKLKQPNADAFSIKSGGGYAFLPLPGLNWPWPVHLHLNAPTNLARSDWNPSDAAATHALLREAAEHCAAWLATNRDCWHSDWQPADLISLPLSELPADSSARIFGEAYANKLSEVPTMRTLWGGFVALNAAIGLQLEPGDAIRRAWSNLAAIIPDELKNEYPLVLNSGGAAHLVERTLNTQQAQAFFRRIRDCLVNAPTESWQNYVRIVVCTEVSMFGGISRGEMIEMTLGSMEMAKAYEGEISFRDSAELKFVVQLKPEWHQLFASLSNWIDPNWALAGTTVFGFRMSQIFRLLSKPAEIPTGWEEVVRMTEADFRRAGDAFWQQHRVDCPANLRTTVIESIWVESGTSWIPLAKVWIGDEPVAMLRNIVSQLDRRAQEHNNARRNNMLQALRRWNLQDVYEKIIKTRIDDCTEDEFIRRLNDDNPKNPDRLRQLVLAENWKPERLPEAWQILVLNAARKAAESLFRRSNLHQHAEKTLVLGSGPMQEVLLWNRQNLAAPTWLNQAALKWFDENDLLNTLRVDTADIAALTQDRTDQLAKALLERFHEWQDVEPTPEQRGTLETLFQRATGTWDIGLPGNVKRRVNEYCDWRTPGQTCDALTHLPCVWSGNDRRNFIGCHSLPEILANISAIRGKTIPLAQFTFKGPDEDDLQQLAEGEIPEVIADNQWFQRLRALAPNARLMAVSGKLDLRWKRGEMEIEIPRASFGFIEGANPIVFVTGIARRAENDGDGVSEQQYRDLLRDYLAVAPEDRVVRTAFNRGRGFKRLYLENRDKILARFVQKHATEMGYEAEHVLRELLQNAESAYGTRRPELQAERKTFTVKLDPKENESRYKVEISHLGRAFNEIDNDGQNCDADIRKLVALAAEANQNQENLGRFNRGFKSLFNVTNSVRVKSGGYDFTVEDMLMLNPIEPEPQDAYSDNSTIFEFNIDAVHFSKMLRESEGKLSPFRLEELVFLKHIDEIRVEIDFRPPIIFVIERCSLENGLQMVTIIERRGRALDGQRSGSRKDAGIEKGQFLIRRVDADNDTIAIAVVVDSDGMPKALPKDQRRFYRTFPLREQSQWLNGLINADFATDHGRTGWRPAARNGTFVAAALAAYLEMIQGLIFGTTGRIECWLAWVKSVERGHLNDVCNRLPDHEAHLGQVINKFDAWLWQHLPNGELLSPVNEFQFPSRLLRRLDEDVHWRQELELDGTGWIDERVAEAMSEFGALPKRDLDLKVVVERLLRVGKDMEKLRAVLEEIRHGRFARDFIAGPEIEMALGLVAQRQVVEFRELLVFLPEDILSQDEEGEIGEGIETSDLNIGWNEHEALKEFSLAGWMGRLVFDCEEPGTPDQQRLIFASPDTQKGKECWHRLLCLGSLLGARARSQTVRRFWAQQLRSRAIFSATGEHELAKLLDEVSHRTFTDLDTTGENAEMWRRVFYDFQKLRLFVFDDDLPGSFLEHLRSSEEWDAPINFLKSGFRKNESRWAGSVGQSMTAPLFWIVRELRRIRLIEDPIFDPSCYYVNGPARRVLRRLPGFEGYDLRDYGFEKLLGLSQRCHELLNHDFPNHFDLPLQWYALNNR